MSCLPQVLGHKPSVRTAVIPTAGLIGGLFPASKAVSPGLLPIADSDGVLKPAGRVVTPLLLLRAFQPWLDSWSFPTPFSSLPKHLPVLWRIFHHDHAFVVLQC